MMRKEVIKNKHGKVFQGVLPNDYIKLALSQMRRIPDRVYRQLSRSDIDDITLDILADSLDWLHQRLNSDNKLKHEFYNAAGRIQYRSLKKLGWRKVRLNCASIWQKKEKRKW